MGTCVHFSRSLPSNSWWQTMVGGKSCQGRQPPKAGAAGPPLQGLPPSHTWPPRSTAGNISLAGCLKTGPQYSGFLFGLNLLLLLLDAAMFGLLCQSQPRLRHVHQQVSALGINDLFCNP